MSMILVFGTNTVPFLDKMRDKYGVDKHLHDYILIVNDKVELQSNDLTVISQAIDGQEHVMLTKTEFVNQ